MANRYYANSPIELGQLALAGPEAHHLASVMRVAPGDPVRLFNGDGRSYDAVVLEVAKKYVELDVRSISEPQPLPCPAVRIGMPLPKADRADWLIEKLTELGVASFVPLKSEHSIVLPRDAKLEKLQQRVIEACKQCGRNRLLELESLASLEAFLQQPADGVRCFAQFGGMPWSDAIPEGTHSVSIAIGPEGGFSPRECDRAAELGWIAVSLGPNVLRMETAAVAAASWFTLRAKS